MKSDETYLEAFIDHISNVPAELKRNLELMKDLDQTGNELFEEMTQLQHEYVKEAEDKVGRLYFYNNEKFMTFSLF